MRLYNFFGSISDFVMAIVCHGDSDFIFTYVSVEKNGWKEALRRVVSMMFTLNAYPFFLLMNHRIAYLRNNLTDHGSFPFRS